MNHLTTGGGGGVFMAMVDCCLLFSIIIILVCCHYCHHCVCLGVVWVFVKIKLPRSLYHKMPIVEY